MSDEEEEVDDRPRPLQHFPPRSIDPTTIPLIVDRNTYTILQDRMIRNEIIARHIPHYAWFYHTDYHSARIAILEIARLLRENRSNEHYQFLIADMQALSGATRRMASSISDLYDNPLLENGWRGSDYFFSQDLENLLRHERQWARSAYYRQARRRYDNHNPFQLG